MRKILFVLVAFLLFASVTAASLFGAGTLVLIDDGVLRMNNVEVQATIRNMEMRTTMTANIKREMGIDPWKLITSVKETGKISNEALAYQLASHLLKLAFQENWDAANEFSDKYQIKYKVFHSLGRPLGGNMTSEEEKKAYRNEVSRVDKATGKEEKYVVYVLLDDVSYAELPVNQLQTEVFLLQNRYVVMGGFLGLTVLALLLFAIGGILLKRDNTEKRTLADFLPIDLVFCLGGIGWYLVLREEIGWMMAERIISVSLIWKWVLMELFAILMLYVLLWRTQRKGWYHGTVSYVICRALKKVVLAWWEALCSIPTTWKLALFVFFVTAAEAGLILIFMPWQARTQMLLGAWGVLKLLLIPWILRHGAALWKIRTKVADMAGGNMEGELKTDKFPEGLRKMGEDVNAMAGSITLAVNEKMKSERLKTELITNVSHDIKTPLTSIINFSDLIEKEAGEDPKLQEYASHLHGQSAKLKKLIEDLMEASKASTGNLEVHLAPCDVRVLLGQCLGEYESRLKEKGLELILRQSPVPLRIMADPRMLWRVFDNLMNNVCKYAQKDTRVYLSAEQAGDKAKIQFKNVSKYALDVSPEDLLERFVRGDLSRHTEGNGLGLSIVSSLMELQGGKVTLEVDADLFKVTLEFPLTEDVKRETGKEEGGGKEAGKAETGKPGDNGAEAIKEGSGKEAGREEAVREGAVET